jgi:hypothetical protein
LLASKQRSVLLVSDLFFFYSRVCEADEAADLVFRELGVMHVLLDGEIIM